MPLEVLDRANVDLTSSSDSMTDDDALRYGPGSAAGMTPMPSGRRYAARSVLITAASTRSSPMRSRRQRRWRTKSR